MTLTVLNEKTTTVITQHWHRLELDNGDVLLANITVLDKGYIELNRPGVKGVIKIDLGDHALKSVEDVLGYKLDRSNDDVENFLYLLPEL